MDIAEKTLQLKKDFDDVYNKGYFESERDFWDNFTNNNVRDHFEYAFYRSRFTEIKPPYKLKQIFPPLYMFRESKKLKKIESAYFDFSQMTNHSQTNINYGYLYTFESCWELTEIEDIGMPAAYYYGTFGSCVKLKKIAVLRVVKNTLFNGAFTSCNALEDITIEGEVGTNISFKWSPLSTASIVSIIEHLSDTSGATLTLNTTAKNNMVFPYTSPYTNVTYNSWDELISTKQNWTIATASA